MLRLLVHYYFYFPYSQIGCVICAVCECVCRVFYQMICIWLDDLFSACTVHFSEMNVPSKIYIFFFICNRLVLIAVHAAMQNGEAKLKTKSGVLIVDRSIANLKMWVIYVILLYIWMAIRYFFLLFFHLLLLFAFVCSTQSPRFDGESVHSTIHKWKKKQEEGKLNACSVT